MRVAFDLDGTLDRPAIAALAKTLLAGGHEVHVITGTFTEAVGWQDSAAKRTKLLRLGIPFRSTVEKGLVSGVPIDGNSAVLHILDAVPITFGQDYRLRDLGLRKGALCEVLGIELFLDDSDTYCEMVPKMSGGTQVLHVR